MLRKTKRSSRSESDPMGALMAFSKKLESPEHGLPLARLFTEMLALKESANPSEAARQLGVPGAAVTVALRDPTEAEFAASKVLALVGSYAADQLDAMTALDFGLITGLFVARFAEYVEARNDPLTPR